MRWAISGGVLCNIVNFLVFSWLSPEFCMVLLNSTKLDIVCLFIFYPCNFLDFCQILFCHTSKELSFRLTLRSRAVLKKKNRVTDPELSQAYFRDRLSYG